MKTTIYLVRHGESEGNVQRRFIGHTDIALTDLGRRQAEMTAEYLQDIPVDCIYSSDLQRAYDTACATAKRKNLPITKSMQLREIYAGKWEGISFDGLMQIYPEDFSRWKNDRGNARCTGGESVQEMRQRIAKEVQRIARENPGKTVLIFSHATTIYAFRCHCENISAEEMQGIPLPSNASVTHAEYENGKFRLLEYSIDHFMGELVTALPSNV